MKTTIILIAALLLGGCTIPLPTTEGSAEFDAQGKPKSVHYKSTKAQAGFSANVNAKTGDMTVSTDNADSPRGYEDFVQAQMMIELKRLELYQNMFDAAMKAAAQGAPGP